MTAGNMLESKIEAHLVKRVKEYGGHVRKMKWIGRHGAPDRLVLLPAEIADGFYVAYPARKVLIELKQPGQKLKPHQAREHAILNDYFEILVLDSIEAIDEWLPPR